MVVKSELPNPVDSWLQMPLDYFLNAYTHHDIHVPANDLALVVLHAFQAKSPDRIKQISTINQVVIEALPGMHDFWLNTINLALSSAHEDFDEVKDKGPAGLEKYNNFQVLRLVVKTVVRDRAERSDND
ncbi:MAG: hypothetical protein ABII80_03460 [bacterium]